MMQPPQYAEQPLLPPKPVLNDPKQNPLAGALVSLLLFAAFGYLAGGRSVMSVVLLVVIVAIHESGHLAAMWMFGYQKLQMLFIPLAGAVAIGRKSDISEKQSAIVILAGPLPGMLIGYGLLLHAVLFSKQELFYQVGADGSIHAYPGGWEIIAGRFFVYLNAINLLPFFPLDGGQLFRILFFRSGFISYFIFALVSLVLLVFLFWGSSFLLIWIAVSFGLPLFRQYKAQAYYKVLREKGVDWHKSYEELSDHDFWIMRENLWHYQSTFQPLRKGHAYTVPVQPQEIKAIRSLLENRVHDDLGKKGKIFFLALWIVSVLSVFAIDYATGQIGLLAKFMH